LLVKDEQGAAVAHFDGRAWQAEGTMTKGLEEVFTSREGKDGSARLIDLDGDGVCEIVHASGAFRWDEMTDRWVKLPFGLPAGASIVDDRGRDAGLRWVDVDEDGALDIVFANAQRSGVWLFKDLKEGWSRKVEASLPAIVRADGTNNGMWVHSRHLWWQNEDTNKLANLVDRRAFTDLLKEAEPQPKSPAASLASMHIAAGLKVELVAAEPLVMDPVHIAFGPDGKLWVTEMGSYPLNGKNKPSGRVRYLEDVDGDGVYEKSTLFLDGLAYPTGTLPWREGVLVTCAPDIFYAADTDGDGNADKRDVLFTGFAQGNPQHLVNGLSWGLDNWVYGANGDSGGTVKSTKTGKSVSISGRDFRFRPETGEFETVAGQTQFGRTRNDAGDWFGCNNVNPIYHNALDDAYLKRNPHVTPPSGRVDVPKVPGSSPVYPVSRTLARFNDYHTADHFTSACSVHVYRDELMRPPTAGSSWVYISEPVHNLVSRQMMRPNGVTFTSDRAPSEQKSEFLASSDSYFRPTTVTTGPDGAIYIADMYRLVIEHPEWIPGEWQKKLNLRAGEDKGRIYRVSPVRGEKRKIPRLEKLSTEQLVGTLDSVSGWQRDMAHRMLLWRGDKAAIEPLLDVLRRSKNPLAKVHALGVLEGLGQLSEDVLRERLLDEPIVQRQALRLMAKRSKIEAPHGVTFLDPQVRLQFAYVLGEIRDPSAGRMLAELAMSDGSDRLMLAGILSSVNEHNVVEFTKRVLEQTTLPGPLLSAIIRTANGTGKTEALALVLSKLTGARDGEYEPWQFQTLGTLLESLEQSNLSLDDLAKNDELKDAGARVSRMIDAARRTIGDESAAMPARVAALGLLLRQRGARDGDLKLLRDALSPQSPAELQSVAIACLSARRARETPALLLSSLKSFSPGVRGAALDALLAREEWAKALLDAVERKELSAGDLDAPRRQRLLQSSSKSIQQRATKVLAETINPDRQKVIDSFAKAAELKGDPDKGKAVFTRACATCHRAGGEGTVVGPELAAVGDKSPQGLLIAILDPNRAVEPRYLNYIMETNDGDTHTGILVSELDQAVKLLGPGGASVSVRRSNVKEIRAGKTSLMPEGLEAGMSTQDMADLIAYVQTAK
jgi:putative membrane-bound dehydrogenase-like protein